MADSKSAAQPLGCGPSMGFGDRIGLSTPGHIRALRESGLAGKVAPVFAQQSVRENARTGRTPAEVMADARRAVEAAGWSLAWGADADHLKTAQDLKPMAEAGFTFFTVDPSDYVNEAAASMPADELDAAYRRLFSGAETPNGERLVAQYVESGPRLLGDGRTLRIAREDLPRAALVYWKAIQHTIGLYREAERLWQGERPFDFEMSVDETSAPTSHAAHYVIASELRQAGVRLTSLAPRFVGAFEKGIDYKGDLDPFEAHLEIHAAIARALGPYKLSVHSGSDKFSIYPLLARYAGAALHLKTAGTSYLEALRIPARRDPPLFRAIARLAVAHFGEARASYHLSTDLARVPDPDQTADADLERRFLQAPEANDARQVLHVAYGDVLRHPALGPALRRLVAERAEEHAEDVARHLARHLAAFKV